MKIIGFLLALLALVGTPSQTVAPVEVHIQEGDTLYMYDCYPLTGDNNSTVVYINYDTGIAAYSCALSQVTTVAPIAPPPANDVFALFIPTSRLESP